MEEFDSIVPFSSPILLNCTSIICPGKNISIICLALYPSYRNVFAAHGFRYLPHPLDVRTCGLKADGRGEGGKDGHIAILLFVRRAVSTVAPSHEIICKMRIKTDFSSTSSSIFYTEKTDLGRGKGGRGIAQIHLFLVRRIFLIRSNVLGPKVLVFG